MARQAARHATPPQEKSEQKGIKKESTMKFVATPALLSTASSTFDAEFKARLHWSDAADAAIEQVAATILNDVKLRGDAAVL